MDVMPTKTIGQTDLEDRLARVRDLDVPTETVSGRHFLRLLALHKILQLSRHKSSFRSPFILPGKYRDRRDVKWQDQSKCQHGRVPLAVFRVPEVGRVEFEFGS